MKWKQGFSTEWLVKNAGYEMQNSMDCYKRVICEEIFDLTFHVDLKPEARAEFDSKKVFCCISLPGVVITMEKNLCLEIIIGNFCQRDFFQSTERLNC